MLAGMNSLRGVWTVGSGATSEVDFSVVEVELLSSVEKTGGWRVEEIVSVDEGSIGIWAVGLLVEAGIFLGKCS